MDEERKRPLLKQQARNQERKSFLSAMPMTLAQANSLIQTLDAQLARTPCDHTLRLTFGWCGRQGLDRETVANWTRSQGGYCDCEVAANLADPIEDAGRLEE